MAEEERAEDWLPESVARRRPGTPPRRQDRDPDSWSAEERRLRARRLSQELTDWVSELRARSQALDSRLRDTETAG